MYDVFISDNSIIKKMNREDKQNSAKATEIVTIIEISGDHAPYQINAACKVVNQDNNEAENAALQEVVFGSSFQSILNAQPRLPTPKPNLLQRLFGKQNELRQNMIVITTKDDAFSVCFKGCFSGESFLNICEIFLPLFRLKLRKIKKAA